MVPGTLVRHPGKGAGDLVKKLRKGRRSCRKTFTKLQLPAQPLPGNLRRQLFLEHVYARLAERSLYSCVMIVVSVDKLEFVASSN